MAEKASPATISGSAVERKAIDRFRDALALAADAADDFDAQEIAANVVENIMTAETDEAAFAAQDSSMPSGKDMADVEMLVNDFNVSKGDTKYEEHSIGYYMRVDATILETGTDVRFATGAINVMALLWKVTSGGSRNMPYGCVIRSRDTANGALLTLRPLAKRAVKVKTEV